MFASAKNYREIAGHAADIPQHLLEKMGAEWNWFRLRYKHPSESTIRNVLTRIDAAELDIITGTWLYAQARKDGKGEWVIALDRKVMRGAWTDESDKVTMFSAMLHHEAVTIAQVRVPDGTNEITQAGTLLDAGNTGRRISPGHHRRGTHPAGNRRIHRRQTRMELPDDRQGKPAGPAEASIRRDSPAALRSSAPHHGGTQPGTNKRNGPAGSPAPTASISRMHPGVSIRNSCDGALASTRAAGCDTLARGA